MRVVPILALALAVLPHAAAFSLGAEKIVEAGLAPGDDVTLGMPLVFDQAGFFYAKLLATPGNAVNDGNGPNGSWSVTYALVRAGGAREELGSFQNSALSRLAAVAEGEAARFEATVHVPDDAAKGGPAQSVYVALAWRPTESGLAPGASSGAQMDEARAITLLLTDALLPPAEAQPEPQPDPDVPPVAPIESSQPPATRTQVVVGQAFPTWFLIAGLVLVAALVGTTGVAAWALVAIARRSPPEARAIPVRVEPPEPQRVVEFERVR